MACLDSGGRVHFSEGKQSMNIREEESKSKGSKEAGNSWSVWRQIVHGLYGGRLSVISREVGSLWIIASQTIHAYRETGISWFVERQTVHGLMRSRRFMSSSKVGRQFMFCVKTCSS